MGKTEHKTCIGLCSSFANLETHLAFMESTCSKKDFIKYLKALILDVATSATGGVCRDVGVHVL